MGQLVIVNLFAKFGNDADANEATKKFGIWTGMNWCTTQELVRQLDQVLRAVLSSGKRRVITQKVLHDDKRVFRSLRGTTKPKTANSQSIALAVR
ncbi:MAG: hypothetical protein H7Z42_05610, partial [Roseiflexaceae bacterium]|nr:hypothetical protein [Roseiflexaceae bacterium]